MMDKKFDCRAWWFILGGALLALGGLAEAQRPHRAGFGTSPSKPFAPTADAGVADDAGGCEPDADTRAQTPYW